MSSEIEGLRKDLSALKAENADLRKDLAAKKSASSSITVEDVQRKSNGNPQQEIEELHIKLTSLSEQLAKKEIECSHQLSVIEQLKKQRDELKRQLANGGKIDSEVGSALKLPESNPYFEENKALKLQLEKAEAEAEKARSELVRLQANTMASPEERGHAESNKNGVQAAKQISESSSKGNFFRFELPSLKKMPVSRREGHPLGSLTSHELLTPLPRSSNPSAQIEPLEVTLIHDVGEKPAQVSSNANQQRIAEVQKKLDSARQNLRTVAESPGQKANKVSDKISITVHSGQHLPKVDTLGSIDGFVHLESGNQTKKTQVIKNSLRPDWNETFEFTVEKEKALKVSLYDWERLGKPRLIGTVILPIKWLRESKIQNGLFSLKDQNDAPVTGKDGQVTALHLEIYYRVAENDDPKFRALETEIENLADELALLRGEGSIPTQTTAANKVVLSKDTVQLWKLHVCLQRAVNLPKMDVMGKADPYVILQVNTQQYKSQTIKNTLDPEWNENFVFSVEDENAELFLTVMDWDLGKKDDTIGLVKVKISDFLGKDHVGPFDILKKDSQKFVTGKDGGKSSVILSLKSSVPVIRAAHSGSFFDPKSVRSLPVTMSAIIDEHFDSKCGTFDKHMSFVQSFKEELASILALSPHDLAILDCQKHQSTEMIIMDINILPLGMDEKTAPPERLPRTVASDFLQRLAAKDASLQKLKIIAGTIQNRFGQLEAENAYLLTQSSLMMQRLDTLDKAQKLSKSEVSMKAMKRLKFSSLSKCFSTWAFNAFLEKVNKESDLKQQDLQQTLSRTEENAKIEQGKLAEQITELEKETREHAEAIKQQESELRNQLAQAKLESGGPYIKVTIIEAKYLPKVDTIGWIDAFFDISFCYSTITDRPNSEGVKDQQTIKAGTTHVVRKNENPEWNETCKVPLVDIGSEACLVFDLFDWERVSKPRHIAALKISVNEIRSAGSMTKEFSLQKNDGSTLVGRDSIQSLVKLDLKYEMGDKNPAIVEALKKLEDEKKLYQQTTERQRELQEMQDAALYLAVPFELSISLICARHLPQMDKLGSIDPYCIFRIGAQEYRSSACKNTYEPVWKEEKFKFHVTSRSQSLEIRLMDQNQITKDNLCGTLCIPVGKLKPGQLKPEVYLLNGAHGEAELIGKNNKRSELELQINAQEISGLVAPETETRAPWKLEVTLDRAEHLPKMDTFGLCDAYGILSLCGQRANSQIQKNTLDPVWNQSFEFTVTSSNEELVINLKDWDLTGDDEFIGIVHVPVGKIRKLLDESDSPHKETSPICHKDGQRVKGHDGKNSMLVMTFKRLEEDADKHDGILQPGTLTISVQSASNLPKRGFLSEALNPFIIFQTKDGVYKTTTKKKTIDPVWDESFKFQCDKDTKIVIGEMGSYSTSSSDKKLGYISIPVQSTYRMASKTFKLAGTLEDGTPAQGEVYLLLDFKPNEDDESEEKSSGNVEEQKFNLRVTVESVTNLPKMDTFGACDPYVKLQVGNQTKETVKFKNVFDAAFNQFFDFDSVGLTSTLTAIIFDWNRCTADSEVGRVNIPLLDIKQAGGQQVYGLTHAGSKVYGKDSSMQTMLKLNLSITEHVTEETRHLVVFEIKSCRHMPRMDIFAKCDPFFTILLDDIKVKTKVLNNCLDGVFNQIFELPCASYMGKKITVTAYDWDAEKFSEYIGEYSIALDDAEHCECEFSIYELQDKSQRRVKGLDGQNACFEARAYITTVESKRQNTQEDKDAAKNHSELDSMTTEEQQLQAMRSLHAELDEYKKHTDEFQIWKSTRFEKLMELQTKIEGSLCKRDALESDALESKFQKQKDALESKFQTLLGEGYTSLHKDFIVGIIVTLLQLLLLKTLLLGY